MAYQPKSYRKFVATAATATLVASAVTPAFAAETGAAASFTDVSDRYKEAVDYLVDNKITLGVTDTQFGTEQAIKRVDAAVMIAKALEIDIADRPSSGFTDVPERAVAYVDALKAEGIINGKTATTFGSAQDITRGEIALILANAYDLNGTSDKEFSDVSSRYAAAVEALVAAGITQGKTATQFGTADAIKRGEFAIFLYKAEQGTQPGVSNVAASTTAGVTTVSATVANAKDGDQATIEIFANGNTSAAPAYTKVVTVSGGKVTTTFNGVPAGTHLAKVTVGEVSGQANFTVAQVDANVGSAMAINGQEVQIKFDQPVDKNTAIDYANYSIISADGATRLGVLGTIGEQGKLSEDGKVVTFRLAAPLVNNQKYAVNVTDGVLDTQMNKVKPSASGQMTFSDTNSPTLSEVTANVQDKILTFTFNEPLATTEFASLKVDGITLNAPTVDPVEPNQPGNYVYEVDLSGATQFNDIFKTGTHEVVLYDVQDVVGNKAAVVNKTYTVTSDTTAPTVTKVEAANSQKFRVTFSEALAATPTIEVKKGNFALTQGTHYQVFKDEDNKNSYLVVLNQMNFSDPKNPLYAENENSINLNVKVSNYKDNADLIGQIVESNITLTKDTKTPTVANAADNDVIEATNELLVKFNGNVAVEDPTKIVVRDKNGALATFNPDDVEVQGGDVVSITVPSYEADKAPYSVEFKAGAVKYNPATTFPTGDPEATDYSLNDNKNTAFTTTVKDKDAAVEAVYVRTATQVGISGAQVTNETRKLQINFGKDMGASAKELGNYTFDGKALPTGTTIDFVDGMQSVLITLPESSVKVTETGRFVISSNVKTKDGSSVVANAQTKEEIASPVEFEDNTDPKLVSAQFKINEGDTTSNQIVLKFDENVNDLDPALSAAELAKELEVTVGNVKIPLSTVAGIEDPAAYTGDEYLTINLGQLVNISQSTNVTLKVADGQTEIRSIVDIEGNNVDAGAVTVSGTTTIAK